MGTALRAPISSIDQDDVVSRLVSHYLRATEDQKFSGRTWYDAQREVIRDLSYTHDIPVTIVAAVVSALSPQTPWARNIAGAVRLIRAYQTGDAEPPRSVTVYYSNAIKAWSLLSGSISPESAFASAPKTRAFWRNLCGDESHATVDIWMARACGVSNTGTTSDGRMSQKLYRQLASALRAAAETVGEPVAQFQAIVWIVVRGTGE